MRPTVPEQIDGACRVLEQHVAPQLDDGHARDLLAGVVRHLRMLQGSWDELPAFLRWDNAEMLMLLEAARAAGATAAVVNTVDALAPGPPPDGERLNDRLRAALTEVVTGVDADDPAVEALRSRVVDHLYERAGRYPWRSTVEMPVSTTDAGTGSEAWWR